MTLRTTKTTLSLVGAAVAGAVALGGGTALAQTVKIGTPSFLTGAAHLLGIRQKGAELIVRGINNGELPAPYK